MLGLLAAAILLGWHRVGKPARPTELTVVLADFVNITGEPAFDDVLNTALAAKLQQTPFLALMPASQIHTALRYMGLPAQSRLTQEVARQVCRREGGQVVLQGHLLRYGERGGPRLLPDRRPRIRAGGPGPGRGCRSRKPG
jgi:hypothetical protein